MKDAAELKSHVYDIVGALHSVHDELGPGINEYCYQEALAMELSDRGIPFEREKPSTRVTRGVRWMRNTASISYARAMSLSDVKPCRF